MSASSPSDRSDRRVDDAAADFAAFLAMCVRNALEGTMHGGELDGVSLSDEQMAILNPLVRNAIATGLHCVKHQHRDPAARLFVEFQTMLIPDYWERAELLSDYLDVAGEARMSNATAEVCRRCGREIVLQGLRDDVWTHLSADGGRNRGCRAATFEPGVGWDDTLKRTWSASPQRVASP